MVFPEQASVSCARAFTHKVRFIDDLGNKMELECCAASHDDAIAFAKTTKPYKMLLDFGNGKIVQSESELI